MNAIFIRCWLPYKKFTSQDFDHSLQAKRQTFRETNLTLTWVDLN